MADLIICPKCGADMTNFAYEIDDEYVCEGCFREWLSDYAETNAVEIARALSVLHIPAGIDLLD